MNLPTSLLLILNLLIFVLTGNRPINATDSNIQNVVDSLNKYQNSYSRGYRFILTEAEEIGWVGGQFLGPSMWYNIDFHDANYGADWKDDMEKAAKNNPSAYLWRTNAINIYINNVANEGICSLEDDEIIIIGTNFLFDQAGLLHEIGHYFNLCHTQGCSCGECENGESGKCHTRPGDDKIDDTLPDLHCWDKNDIAFHAFRMNYNLLQPYLQKLVDDVHQNIMSYHRLQGVKLIQLTEGQLDVWTNTANDGRSNVVSGKNWIVAQNMWNLLSAHANAAPNDLIILRSGSYVGNITLDNPITIRASRDGPITLGVASQNRKAPFPEIIDAEVSDTAQDFVSKISKLHLYPNPSQGVINIEFELEEATSINLYIRNSMG